MPLQAIRKKPNFTTVLNVLDAMGFQLHVTVRPSEGAARLKSVTNYEEPNGDANRKAAASRRGSAG